MVAALGAGLALDPSLAASRLATTIKWTSLPAETVSARLGRWLTSVHLGDATDAMMPAEVDPGSTSLLEIVRACCDYVGRPLRLVDNGTSTEVHAVSSALTLPTGYSTTDALTMYSTATVATSAGDRELSFDPPDATLNVSADLVNDDVRVLYSSWRILDALPAPFADTARVSAFTMTFTPETCSGSIEFDYSTGHTNHYRPPHPYVPGDPSTSKGHGGSTGTEPNAAYMIVFAEVTPPTTDTPTPPTGTYDHHYGDTITIQTTGLATATTNYLTTGTATAAQTIDIHAGDIVFAYASNVAATVPTITSSDPTACPLIVHNSDVTVTTACILSTGTNQADGAYVIAANGTATVALSIVVVTPG